MKYFRIIHHRDGNKSPDCSFRFFHITLYIQKNTWKPGDGFAAMVDGLAERVEEELGEKATVVLTGSVSALVAPCCRRKIVWDENLQLDGLRLIYEKNLRKGRKS